MKITLHKLEYHIRVWLARRWCDPQLAWLAERYGAVLVTSSRYGKLVIPIYQAGAVGAVEAKLAQQLDDMTKQRDYWKRVAHPT